MDKYGLFSHLSSNKYSLRQLCHMHPDCFKPYKNLCYLVEYIIQGLYASDIFISFRDFKFYVSSISFRDFKLYASGISYYSGMFIYYYPIIHIDIRISNFCVTTKLIKILNEIASITRAYISFIINTRFLHETLLHKLYFIISFFS